QGLRYNMGQFASKVGKPTATNSSGGTVQTFTDYSSPAVIEDSNGNQFNNMSPPNSPDPVRFTDTLARALSNSVVNATAPIDASDCQGRLPVVQTAVVNLPGPNGTTSVLKFCYSDFPLGTLFSVQV